MEKKKFLKGDFICRENSPGSDMYVIQSGKVGVYKTINGEKIALGVLNPGDFCGEMSLLLKSNRTASLLVLEDTEVMVLHKEAFLRKVQEDPKFAFFMISKISLLVNPSLLSLSMSIAWPEQCWLLVDPPIALFNSLLLKNELI